MQCPLCNSKDIEQIGKKIRISYAFWRGVKETPLYRCKRCHVKFNKKL